MAYAVWPHAVTLSFDKVLGHNVLEELINERSDRVLIAVSPPSCDLGLGGAGLFRESRGKQTKDGPKDPSGSKTRIHRALLPLRLMRYGLHGGFTSGGATPIGRTLSLAGSDGYPDPGAFRVVH